MLFEIIYWLINILELMNEISILYILIVRYYVSIWYFGNNNNVGKKLFSKF